MEITIKLSTLWLRREAPSKDEEDRKEDLKFSNDERTSWREAVKRNIQPTSLPRQSRRDGETVETVVGKTLVGRGTSSACKRSRSQPSYSIRARSLRRLHQTGRMYGSISPLNHHRLGAWQSGGVHVRLTNLS